MGRNNMAIKTHPCQYRKEPAGRKRNTAMKMSAKRLRRMSRVVRLRRVDIGFAVTGNDKERVAESSDANSRGGGETPGGAVGESLARTGYASIGFCVGELCGCL